MLPAGEGDNRSWHISCDVVTERPKDKSDLLLLV